ncbi:MAG: hypothetical protein ACE5HJ_07260 [Thermoplasmata archaeon]
MLRVLQIGPSKVSLLPVIKGLVSEAKMVREHLQSAQFDAVALSISPEELDVIFSNPSVRAPPSSTEEEVYMRELKRFGPVKKPPPCFVEAVRIGRSQGLECFPLDMNEEEFTELYCREVSGLELIRYSLRLKKLTRSSFQAETPDDFVLQFDAFLNWLRGHRRVEETREAHISASIASLCSQGFRPLVLVELERFDGVSRRLEKVAPSP